MSPHPGKPVTVADNVCRITAPNPGPMTGSGTNTYIVGSGPVAVIDPGVDEPAHRAAIRAAAGDAIAAIVLTHRHGDHAGGAAALAAATEAPLHALPKDQLGAYDTPLAVDVPLTDGETLILGDIKLEAIHTPGHAADHVCFYARETGLLFAGDSVMAGVTVVIAPPDGDMSAYLTSIARLQALAPERIAPGHGRILDNPEAVFTQVLSHRHRREAQVRAALDTHTPRTPAAIAGKLYPRLDGRLHRAATAQVEAHLIRLAELGVAVRDGAVWRVAGN
jgi:glyoxylase-like metal-dependent hydrolase (beta-lactamase superfamily II)